MIFTKPWLGLYEKALPIELPWRQRLATTKILGFQFMEMSIDESEVRQQRLDWTYQQRLEFINNKLESGIDVPGICLSAHRQYPFGSAQLGVRQKARELLEKALVLSVDLGMRYIQIAGYDVYYESSDRYSQQRFIDGMQWAISQAAKAQIMLSVEIMDTPFINSISRWREIFKVINNPWFSVYPDIGNLSAWQNDLQYELTCGIDKITAIHLKDTLPVTYKSCGQFRGVPFGKGCVDFRHAFSVLRKLDYQGPYLLEMWARGDGQDKHRINEAKLWIEQQMQVTNE